VKGSSGCVSKKAQNHKVRDIASEGEQRCVALAAFLAELSLASHRLPWCSTTRYPPWITGFVRRSPVACRRVSAPPSNRIDT